MIKYPISNYGGVPEELRNGDWLPLLNSSDINQNPANGQPVLTATGVIPGTYGDAFNVAQFTVDDKGRIHFAGNVSLAAASGTVSSVTFQDGDGFDGTVVTATTTPVISLKTTLTQGSVPFISPTKGLAEDNGVFFWDNVNKRLAIGHNAAQFRLHVEGTTYSHNVFNSGPQGGYAAFFSNAATIPSGMTFQSGYTWAGAASANRMTFAGSTTINQGAIIAGHTASTLTEFTTAGTTITMTQAAGIRAMAGFQILSQIGGTLAGTVSHGASLMIQGVYPASTGVINFTNYYALLINQLDEWGIVTFTNRWGIYQHGTNDPNYLGSRLQIGNISSQGNYNLQVTGGFYANVTGATMRFAGLTTDNTAVQVLARNASGDNVWKDGTTVIGVPDTHAFLSSIHTDTVASAPIRGGLIVANATPAWAQLAKGTTNQILQAGATDVGWVTISGDIGLVAGVATIPNNTVTYAKMQDISQASVLLGRGSAAGAGDPQEILLDVNSLVMTATTLNVKKQMSIDSDTFGLKLVNDAAAPGNAKYYGTSSVGTKGFFDLPTSIVEGEWNFTTPVTMADPGSGKFRTNQITFAASTQIAISDISALGIDRTPILQVIQPNDLIYIQDKGTASNWVRYQVTGAPIDNGTWWQIPVINIEANGVLPTNNTPSLFHFTGQPSAGAMGITQLTSDVLAGPGSGVQVATIAPKAVTYAKMQDMATARIHGRITAGTGSVEELTGGQVTSLLTLFSTTTTAQGVVVGSNNVGATFFLNATGAWSTIPASSIGAGTALTRTNDTNVTLTLGGSPTTALLAATSMTLGWTGTLATTRGGTGLAAYVIGDILYASATNVLSALAGNVTTAKQFLSQTGSGAVSAAPVWATISGADITGAALTKTDDTNVTLTLGGTPTTALLRAASITVGWAGTLAVTRGGTGLAAIAQGDIIYGSGVNTFSILNKVATATRYLSNTGATNNPAWAQVDLSNGVTGTLPSSALGNGIARSVFGVTGNAAAARADIQNTAADQVLVANGANTAIVWGTVATGGITNSAVTYAKIQNVSATSRFLGRITAGAGVVEELTGTQATSLLDLFSTTTATKGVVPGSAGVGATFFLRADGVWGVPAGGGGGGYTVLSQFVDETAWRMFYSNAAGDVTALAFGTSGQVLQSTGATSAPIWATAGGSGTIAGTIAATQVAYGSAANTITGSSDFIFVSGKLTLNKATSTNLQLGNSTSAQVADPVRLNMGASYSNAAGLNPKILLYDDGAGVISGFGISSSQLDYIAFGGSVHTFYVGATNTFIIGTTVGSYVDVNITANKKLNFITSIGEKINFYQAGGGAADFAIGIASATLYYNAAASSKHSFQLTGVEAFSVGTTGTSAKATVLNVGDVGLLIQAKAGQVAPLLQINDSSPTNIFQVDIDGAIESGFSAYRWRAGIDKSNRIIAGLWFGANVATATVSNFTLTANGVYTTLNATGGAGGRLIFIKDNNGNANCMVYTEDSNLAIGWSYNTVVADTPRRLNVRNGDSITNTVFPVARFERYTYPGAPVAGSGVSLEFSMSTQASATNVEVSGSIASVMTSAASGAETFDIVLYTNIAGSAGTPTETFRSKSTGEIVVQTLANDDALTRVAVWDNASKLIKWRSASTFGSGTIAGSIAATQVAYGSATNTITGSSNFTFNAGVLRVDSQIGIGVTPLANASLHVSGVGAATGSVRGNIVIDQTDAYSTAPTSGIVFRLKYNSAGSFAEVAAIDVRKENAGDGTFGSRLIFWNRIDGSSGLNPLAEFNGVGDFMLGNVSSSLGDIKLQVVVPTATKIGQVISISNAATVDAFQVRNSSGTLYVRMFGGGGISVIGSGSASERYGAFATAAGAGGTSVGYNSHADADYATAIGYAANAPGEATIVGSNTSAVGTRGTRIGAYGTASGYGSTSIGYGASASGSGAIVIGNYNTSGAGATSVTIGYAATAQTEHGVAIGTGTNVTGVAGIALGNGALAGHNFALSIGYNSSATGSCSVTLGPYMANPYGNSMLIGNNAESFTYYTLVGGNGHTHGAPAGLVIKATSGVGTDIVGGNMIIQTGLGTGAGAATSITMQTSDPIATGTTAQTYSTKLTVGQYGIQPYLYYSNVVPPGGTAGYIHYNNYVNAMYMHDGTSWKNMLTGGSGNSGLGTAMDGGNGIKLMYDSYFNKWRFTLGENYSWSGEANLGISAMSSFRFIQLASYNFGFARDENAVFTNFSGTKGGGITLGGSNYVPFCPVMRIGGYTMNGDRTDVYNTYGEGVTNEYVDVWTPPIGVPGESFAQIRMTISPSTTSPTTVYTPTKPVINLDITNKTNIDTTSIGGGVPTRFDSIGIRINSYASGTNTAMDPPLWHYAIQSIAGRNLFNDGIEYGSKTVDTTYLANVGTMIYRSDLGKFRGYNGTIWRNLAYETGNTAWRMYYTDGSGTQTELAFGSAGQVLQTNGATAAPSWVTPAGGTGGSPGGSNTNVQFNNSGGFGGSPSFTWSGQSVSVTASQSWPSYITGTLFLQSYSLANSWISENAYHNAGAGGWYSVGASGGGVMQFGSGEAAIRLFPTQPAGTLLTSYMIISQFKLDSTGGFGIGGAISSVTGNYGGSYLSSDSTGNLSIATIANDDAQTKVMMWDSATKLVKYRTASTLGGSGSTKFGVVGQDSAAAEQRSFNLGTFNYTIQTTTATSNTILMSMEDTTGFHTETHLGVARWWADSYSNALGSQEAYIEANGDAANPRVQMFSNNVTTGHGVQFTIKATGFLFEYINGTTVDYTLMAIPQAVGTKTLRYDPATGAVTYHDIPTGGGSPPTTPGGAANSIQYNSAGSFGGFGTWNGATLAVPGHVSVVGTVSYDNANNDKLRFFTGAGDYSTNFYIGLLAGTTLIHGVPANCVHRFDVAYQQVLMIGDNNASANLLLVNASATGLRIDLKPSQVGDALHVRNSAVNVIASIDATGIGYFQGLKVETLSSDTSKTNIMTWDATDKIIRYRAANTLANSVNLQSTQIAFGSGSNGITSSVALSYSNGTLTINPTLTSPATRTGSLITQSIASGSGWYGNNVYYNSFFRNYDIGGGGILSFTGIEFQIRMFPSLGSPDNNLGSTIGTYAQYKTDSTGIFAIGGLIPLALGNVTGASISGDVAGNITLKTVAQDDAQTQVMVWDSSTKVIKWRAASTLGGGSTSLSALTAATATSDIDNANFVQQWRWNTLGTAAGAGGSQGLLLSSTAASDRTSVLLALSRSGSSSAGTTKGIVVTVSATGAANTGIEINAFGATSNLALKIAGGDIYVETIAQDDTQTKVLMWDSTTKLFKYRAAATLGGGGGGENLDQTMAIGSVLTANRTIDVGVNKLSVTGSGNDVLQATTTGTFHALQGIAAGTASTGVAVEAMVLKPNTGDLQNAMYIVSQTTDTPTVGVGAYIRFFNPSAAATTNQSGWLAVRRTVISATVPQDDFEFWTQNAGTMTKSLVLKSFGNLLLGNTTNLATATPIQVSLGGTLSSTAGANPKLLLYDSSGTQLGFGVSASSLDYIVPSAAVHSFYNGTVKTVVIGATGISTQLLQRTTTDTILQIAPDAAHIGVAFEIRKAGTLVASINSNGDAFFALTVQAGTTITGKYLPKTGTVATVGTLTINSDQVEVYTVTALSGTMIMANPSGTPQEGQKLMIRIKSDATSRTLTWSGTQWRAGDITLPIATVPSKTMYLGFVWNVADSKWDFVSYSDNY